MNIDVVFEATDMNLQVSFDDKLQLVTSGIRNDADKVLDGTVRGMYESSAVTKLKEYAFLSCPDLSGVSLPNCVSIGISAFRGCAALKSANLPNCVSFISNKDGYFFDGASKLQSINVPNLTTIENGVRAFTDCELLEAFDAPNLTSLTNTQSMFAQCRRIKRIHLPKLGEMTIGARTFIYCYWLHTLILGGQFKALENTNAFQSAGSYSEKGLRIYVPDTLVDTYKTATNWSVYADKIKPMSELEEQ